MAEIGDGDAINRMAYAKPARRLSEADILMAKQSTGCPMSQGPPTRRSTGRPEGLTKTTSQPCADSSITRAR